MLKSSFVGPKRRTTKTALFGLFVDGSTVLALGSTAKQSVATTVTMGNRFVAVTSIRTAADVIVPFVLSVPRAVSACRPGRASCHTNEKVCGPRPGGGRV